MGKVYCHICNKRCKGDVLKVHDKFVHKSCFLCCCCKTSLEKGGFFLKDEKYFCKQDYLEKFGVKCKICNEIAEGEVIVIFSKTFHPHCFRCKRCSTVFQRGDKVTHCNGEYICMNCVYKCNNNNNARKKEDTTLSKPDETLTINKENNQSDIDPMTASLITTTFSDSSETESISPEKGYQMDRSLINISKQSHNKSVYSRNLTKDDSQSSDSECFSIRTEPSQSNLEFGRFYNFSYLKLEESLKNQFHPRALYKTSRSNISTASSNIHHYHKIDNFSYRSSPNVTFLARSSKKRTSFENVNDKKKATVETKSVENEKSPKIAKPCLVLTKPTIINGLSPNERSVNSSNMPIKEVMSRNEFHLRSRQGFPMKVVRPLIAIDPISASRVPSANYEPFTKQRYEKHMFSSPSRSLIEQEGLEKMSDSENINIIINDNANSKEDGTHLIAGFGQKHKQMVSRSQVIYPKSNDEDHISVRSFLRSFSKEKLTEDKKPKIYPYEVLKISNFDLPKGIERSKLEIYLSEEDFESIFKISRVGFNRLPEWKRNDLKRRVDLF